MNAANPPVRLEYRLFYIAAILMAVVSIYATRVADPDMWGHLRYGQFFAEHGLVRDDPFAYTSTGRKWFPHEYLSQIVLWEAYDAGGSLGLLGLKWAVAGAAVFFLYLAIRAGCDDPRLWVPVFVLTVGLMARSFLFRPQMFSFLFFCWFVMVLFRFLLGRFSWWWLLTLPPVLAVWANMHGAFMAGIGAVGLALLLRLAQSLYRDGFRIAPLWQRCWPLLLVLLLCFAASFLNPLGVHLWTYLLTEMSHDTNRRLIDEWRPLDIRVHTWSALTLALLLAGLLFAGVMAQLSTFSPGERGAGGEGGRRIARLPPWLWLLSCLPLTLMAFQAVRHIPILTIWAAPVLAPLAQYAEKRTQTLFAKKTASSFFKYGWLLFTGLVAYPALLTIWIVAQDPSPRISVAGETVLGKTTPFRVAAFLRQNDLHGNLYTPLWWGSYFTWELFPDILVSMDGRNVTLFPSKMVEENLLFYVDPAEQVKLDVPLKYPTDYLVIPTDSPVLSRIRKDDKWLAIYDGSDAVLFVRADSAHQDVIRRFREGKLEVPTGNNPKFFQ